MKMRTRVELGLMVLLLAVGGLLLSLRLKDSSAPPPSSTPTPRIASLLQVTIPKASTSVPSAAPTSLPVVNDAAPAPETTVLIIRATEADGSPPLVETEVFIPGTDFVQLLENGRLALAVAPGLYPWAARTREEMPRVTETEYKRISSGEPARLTLVLPIPLQEVETGLGVLPGEDFALVDTVVADSPAAAAGFQEGDVLLEIDGIPVGGLTAEELAPFLRGIEGEIRSMRVVIRNEANELEEVQVRVRL